MLQLTKSIRFNSHHTTAQRIDSEDEREAEERNERDAVENGSMTVWYVFLEDN